jgi:hypothetical protein
MLSDLLRRGPSATTIALLYSAVVLLAVLVVISGLPTAGPQPKAVDYRSLPEYKEMLLQYDKVIEQRERAVKDELARLYEEATHSRDRKLQQFWIDQKGDLDQRKSPWEPINDWGKSFPGVDFPESLSRVLRQYERRYFDASAALKDDYTKLATDLARQGRTKTAENLRAEAKHRWGAVDLRTEPAGEETLVVEPPPVEIPSPPVPPLEEPQLLPEEPPPVVVFADKLLIEEPIASPPIVVEVEGPPPPPLPRRRFIDLKSFECRKDDRRERLVEAFVGSLVTEAAVARALKWLRIHQQRDGLWSLKGPYPDGGADENHVAATAMALLAFQGAGNTTVNGPHRERVRWGWSALLETQDLGGRFGPGLQPPTKRHQCYAQALATIALCELVGMTRNDEAMEKEDWDKYAKRAQRALDFAVHAQGPNGGWRYEIGQAGDMSVTAWYMAAFKAAQMAGLAVPPETLKKIDGFLATVAVKDGSLFGYLKERPNAFASPVTVATSAAGLLCRQQRGWRRDNPLLASGINELVDEHPLGRNVVTDAYACYAVTQVAHHMGGATWQKWNNHMKEVLPAMQESRGAQAGSWDPTNDRWGKEGGRLYITCFCTYMLEVYYRYPPIYEARLDECGLP